MDEGLTDGVRAVLFEDGELTMTAVPGGASRETWLVEGEGGRWVLRRDPEGSVSLVPITEEFALIDRARRRASASRRRSLWSRPEGDSAPRAC